MITVQPTRLALEVPHSTDLRPMPPVSPVTSTAMTTAPAPITSSTAPAGSAALLTAIVSGAFLAALVAAAINIWLARRKSREEERNRLRTSFAEAFAAYTAYKEFPYAIRRRRADQPADERIRLSEALREIQARIAYHLAWTEAESSTVGQAYANLVDQVRAIAGTAMRRAWLDPPTKSDAGMNIPVKVIDLSSLERHEKDYIQAVRTHLRSLAPWWSR